MRQLDNVQILTVSQYENNKTKNVLFYFPFISDFVKDQFCDYSAYGEENQLYTWKHVCGKTGLSQWSRCEMVARLAKMVVVQMERRWAVWKPIQSSVSLNIQSSVILNLLSMLFNMNSLLALYLLHCAFCISCFVINKLPWILSRFSECFTSYLPEQREIWQES